MLLKQYYFHTRECGLHKELNQIILAENGYYSLDNNINRLAFYIRLCDSIF